MNRQQILQLAITVIVVILFLGGCNAPAAPSVAEAPPATATMAPPIATPTPLPPAATPTPSPTLQPASTPQPINPAAQPTVEIKREKITSQALAGNLLGDPAERKFFVLLPPGYATGDKRYPVVYVMPWADGPPGDNAAGFKVAMESLLRQDEFSEMIVVVPDGSTVLGASHMRSSPTIGDYETYVTREVVDYVDAHFRTLPTRDSRGLAGCSNGGGPAMRLGLKYPNIFSVVTAVDGIYNESLEVWPRDVEAAHRLTKLPQNLKEAQQSELDWYFQMAAASAPDPNNPPFYFEMPVRIVDEHGEFIRGVIAKIVEQDAMHEARRYAEQPTRLRGIFIQHGTYDSEYDKQVESFDQLLTDLGIEHEYSEVAGGHCAHGWDEDSLKYLSNKLAFTVASSSSLPPQP